MANYNGTAGNDVFTGGAGNDTAVGNGGDDTLSGAAGQDLLVGGAGSDVLNAGDGGDTLYSDQESPPFNMPYYDNPWSPPLLDTGTEVDTLIGGKDSDRFFAGYGDNVDGGDGGDYLYISFMGAPSGVTVDFRQQTQVIGGGTLTNVENISWVQGSNFADDINVNSYAPSGYSQFTAVFGMGGNDHLVAGYYTGVLDGGDGDDLIDGRGSQYLQKIQGGAGNDTLYGPSNGAAVYGDGGDDTIYSYGTTYGGAGNDVIEIQAGYYPGIVYGEDGDDQIQAGNNAVVIAGGNGSDIIQGSVGADTLFSANIAPYPSPRLPTPDMGLEHDVLNGFGGDDTISAGYGDDIDGGGGSDILYLSFGGAASGVTFNTSAIVSGGQPTTVFGGTINSIETLTWLRGSEFNDVLTVANQASQLTVDGGAGNDVIISSNAPVAALGGAGDDRLVVGTQFESFDGGAGSDTVDYSAYASGVTVNLTPGANPGNDQFTNVENISGTAQNDVLTGDGAANVLIGLAGDDVLDGKAGADTMIGGTGNDTYYVDNAGDVVTEAASEGLDLVYSSVSFTLSANVENLTLTGSATADGIGNELANVITGNAGTNILSGRGGDDTLIGGAGDILLGGAGADILDGSTGRNMAYYYGSSAVTVDLGQHSASGGDASGDTLIAIEDVYGSDFGDILIGSAEANILSGEAGADTLSGGEGDDSLYGVDGDDVLNGENGNDSLSGGNGVDNLNGGAGNDSLNGGAGADLMRGGLGDDNYLVDNVADQVIELAGEGVDYLYVQAGIAEYILGAGSAVEAISAYDTAAFTGVALTGNEFAQQILGDAAGNQLRGGGGDDTLFGYGGDDRLDGGTGADILNGAAGNDTFIVDNALDQIIDSAGTTDQVLVSTASGLTTYTLAAGLGIELMTAADVSQAGPLELIGNDLAQTIIGTVGANRLSGGGGNDTLTGGAGDDILDGGTGNDGLSGGSGADTLTGGDGNDVFRDSAASLNGDTITDFAVGDRLEIADANIVGFSMSRSGSTLTYTGGSLTLSTMPAGYHLLATTAAQGGVVMTWVKDAPRYVDNGLSGDFNGDGKDDLLWRADSGQMSNWLSKADGGYQNNDANALATVPTSWHIVGAGDFNGDGRDDIVWRSDSGLMSDWLGTASGGFVGNDANALTTVSTAWQIVGTGDFNGDGKDDLLWRSDTGQMSNWLGQANGGFVGNDVNAFANVPTSWHIVGTGDFNGDGRDDILWRADGGQMSNWLGQANGGFVGNDGNAFASVSTAWHIVGTGDFNGDGRDDILWRSNTGAMSNWLGQANGGFVGNDANALVSVPTDWVVAATGDYNGDGRTDIAWRNTVTGAVSNWLGQANGGFVGNDANAYQVVDTSWHIQGDGLFLV